MNPISIKLVAPYTYELLEPLVFENDKYIITGNIGMISDGASIPKAFWSIVGCPFGGSYTRAAFLHDLLYRSRIFSKDECDKLFDEAMEQDNVDAVTRSTLYDAVQALGQNSYNEQNGISSYRNLISIEVK